MHTHSLAFSHLVEFSSSMRVRGNHGLDELKVRFFKLLLVLVLVIHLRQCCVCERVCVGV
jgi:hypothetical protein